MQQSLDLLLIGNRDGTNVAGSFERAARQRDLFTDLLETRAAMEGPALLRIVKWKLLGHRPTRLGDFSESVVQHCRACRPHAMIAMGTAPIHRHALRKIGELGVLRLNYLADDPWNPAHRSTWFFEALAEYDHVFNPRRANLSDLRDALPGQVHYLPFGYDPDLFYPPGSTSAVYDVGFAGGADPDRVPYIAALSEAGLRIGLFGSYWERHPQTRTLTGGQIDAGRLREVLASSALALCLVRRANRDGHCMRTFEAPAVGACMLTEDTVEHREIFGPEGEAVVYFRTPAEAVAKTRWLLSHSAERRRLAQAAHELVTAGGHSYGHRLATMLAAASPSLSCEPASAQ